MTISAASRVLVLDGHPAEESLCGSLAVIAAEALEARGVAVNILHLSTLTFDPNLAGG